MIALVAAMDEGGVIGQKGKLPWHLPEDLRRLKALTLGGALIMGRKNYQSIGRPLPGRRNIVLTRNRHFQAPGCEVVHTKEEALEACRHEERVFIFGGAEIYQLFLPEVERMYITRIHHCFPGDTHFPQIDWSEWQEVEREEGRVDEKNPYPHTFLVYDRKPCKQPGRP